MSDVRHIIARGKELTGRGLRQAIESATGTLIGGRGIRVSTVNGRSTVSLLGHVARPKPVAAVFYAQLLGDDPTMLSTNLWEYEWEEVESTGGVTFHPKEGGRTSEDDNRGPARNLHETRNTEQFVLGGVDLTLLPGGLDATELLPATGNGLQPTAQLQAVEMTEVLATDGSLLYWFSFANGIQPTCDPVPSSQLPPPPVRSLLA